MPKTTFGKKIAKLLHFAPLERTRSGWRWGAKHFRSHGIARLLAIGHLIQIGNELHLASRPLARPGHQDAAGAVS